MKETISKRLIGMRLRVMKRGSLLYADNSWFPLRQLAELAILVMVDLFSFGKLKNVNLLLVFSF